MTGKKTPWRDSNGIIVPGRFIEADCVAVAPKLSFGGVVTLQAVVPGTDIVLREHSFHNLITDTGLDRIGSGTRLSMYSACRVGTGTTAPSFSDTALQTPASDWATTSVSGRFAVIAGSSSGIAGQDYWSQYNCRFIWPVGSFVGGANLTEVGFAGGTSGTPANLSVRALIVDTGGAPVAFPVAQDEELRVNYSFRQYLPGNVDWTGSVTITGSGTHDVLMRCVNQGNTPGPGIGSGNGSDSFIYDSGNNNSARAAYTGEPLAFTASGTPTGTLGQSSSVSQAAYTPGSYYRDTSTQWSAGAATGSIRTVVIKGGSVLQFHCRYDPVIVKSATQSLILNHRVSWARH